MISRLIPLEDDLRPKQWAEAGTISRDDALPGVAARRFLHVVEQGAMLRRTGSRIRITRKEAVLADIPVFKLEGILVYGNVQVSSQCLRALADEGVWLAFFTRAGRYKCRLQPPVDRGGTLRRKQHERASDSGFTLDFGKAIVRSKIMAQGRVAAAFAKNYPAESLGDGYRTLRESLERVESVSSLPELRGVEGNAARAYFELFRRWNRSEMPFEGRQKRPAMDPINSLLNFGYALLLSELEGLIEAAGLDPALGFYHLPDHDRPSLACDWMEEFRHIAVDRMVLTLINRGTVKAADFDSRDERGGCRLSPEALRRVLTAWEKTVLPLRSAFLDGMARLVDSIAGRRPYVGHVEADTCFL